jgi:hypothetical protein
MYKPPSAVRPAPAPGHASYKSGGTPFAAPDLELLTKPADPPPWALYTAAGDAYPVVSVDQYGNLYVYGSLLGPNTPGGLAPSGDPSGATDSQNVQGLINLGLPVQLATGTFTFDAPWDLVSGSKVTGNGRLLTQCNWVAGQSALSTAGTSQVDGVEIADLSVAVTGAHLSTAAWIARWYVHDCGLTQNSAGYGLWNVTLSGSQTMVECRFERNSETVFGATRTVEAWFLSGPGGSNQVNANVWRDEVCFNQNDDASQYWYHLQNTGALNQSNLFDNVLFEHPYGGMIWLESHTNGKIDHCFAYDLPTGSGTVSNHLIQVSKNSGGQASARNRVMGGVRIQSGAVFAAGVGDIGLDANCTDTTIVAPAASGSLKLYLNGSKGVKLVGCPDGGWGIQDSAVTAAAGSAAGAGPPAPAVIAGPDNQSGTVTFGTGTGPGAGQMATVTFGTPFETTPNVIITPYNSASSALGLYLAAPGLTGFSADSVNAPSASQANTVYGFRWVAWI